VSGDRRRPPGDGSVYLTTSAADILSYCRQRNCPWAIAEENLRKDYSGVYDPTKSGHMGYNWRRAVWHPTEQTIYGVHGNSGCLFRWARNGAAYVLSRVGGNGCIAPELIGIPSVVRMHKAVQQQSVI
jgi:hypothetical protein